MMKMECFAVFLVTFSKLSGPWFNFCWWIQSPSIQFSTFRKTYHWCAGRALRHPHAHTVNERKPLATIRRDGGADVPAIKLTPPCVLWNVAERMARYNRHTVVTAKSINGAMCKPHPHHIIMRKGGVAHFGFLQTNHIGRDHINNPHQLIQSLADRVDVPRQNTKDF